MNGLSVRWGCATLRPHMGAAGGRGWAADACRGKQSPAACQGTRPQRSGLCTPKSVFVLTVWPLRSLGPETPPPKKQRLHFEHNDRKALLLPPLVHHMAPQEKCHSTTAPLPLRTFGGGRLLRDLVFEEARWTPPPWGCKNYSSWPQSPRASPQGQSMETPPPPPLPRRVGWA